MSKRRRTFSAEFKREAATLVLVKATAISRPAVRWRRGLGALGKTAPGRASRRHAEEQGAGARAAEDPGAGSQDQPAGTGESDVKKATALLMSDELDRTR